MTKFCICGTELTQNTGGYMCPKCFRHYTVNGRLINSNANQFIEFAEHFDRRDDTTMQYKEDEQ